jgi:hypothetical protein
MERYRPKMNLSEFERAAAGTRLQAKAVEIGQSYLVRGLSLAETAAKHAVTRERVRQVAARITRQARS